MQAKKIIESASAPAFPEVHLSDIIKFFKKYIWTLTIAISVSASLGLLASFTITKTYTAKTILLPEYSTSRPSFFSLAMGAGSAEGTGTLVPELYPSILESTSFGQYLSKQAVTTSNGTKFKSLADYLRQSASPSIFSRIKSGVTSQNVKPKSADTKLHLDNEAILNYTKEEEGLIRTAKSLVKASIEQKNGLIGIESELADPVVAAILVEASKNYLINYVEDFRVAKLEQQLSFISSRAAEARKRQQNAEYALQSYRDHNRNSFLNVARIEEQRLQSDFTLAQSIYSDLILKQEQTKIKVKEERPVFKVLEPTKIPLDKTNPKRIIFIGLGAVLGGLSTLLYLLIVKEKVVRHFLN